MTAAAVDCRPATAHASIQSALNRCRVDHEAAVIRHHVPVRSSSEQEFPRDVTSISPIDADRLTLCRDIPQRLRRGARASWLLAWLGLASLILAMVDVHPSARRAV